MNKELPKITIVTVCYNCKEYIEGTLLSVINQDYRNIEYIIVDGASTDGTLEIINSIIKDLETIVKLISEPDNGIYDAMNKGLENASGDWIIFMNGGDKFASSKVLSEIFNSPNDYEGIAVLYGDTIQKYNGIGSFHRSYANADCERVYGNVCHQATLVRSELWKKVGFPMAYRICADFASLKMIYKLGGKFQYLPITIAEFDQTDGASAFSFVRMFSESVRLYDIKKYSKEWLFGYMKSIIKQSLLAIITKKGFIKIRYIYLKGKFTSQIHVN